MTAWWQGPMCGWDLETTDKDPEQARIVTSSVVSRWPGREPTIYPKLLVNPGVPIPAEATEIHGITDEMALLGVDPQTAVAEIVQRLHNARDAAVPIIGMNLSYDYTVLDREARRHNVITEQNESPVRALAAGPVIDIYVLDKQIDPFRRGSRKLDAMCAHYGVKQGAAHDSTEDVLAALRVAWVMGRLSQASHVDLDMWYRQRGASYKRGGSTPFLGQMQALREIGRMDLAALHRAQIGWRWAQAMSLQAHLRKTDPTAVCDPHWPLRPHTPEVAGVS